MISFMSSPINLLNYMWIYFYIVRLLQVSCDNEIMFTRSLQLYNDVPYNILGHERFLNYERNAMEKLQVLKEKTA